VALGIQPAKAFLSSLLDPAMDTKVAFFRAGTRGFSRVLPRAGQAAIGTHSFQAVESSNLQKLRRHGTIVMYPKCRYGVVPWAETNS